MNHAQEAADRLEIVGTVTWEEAPHVEVALAQAHATLALVEQQRLANLIAAIVKWGGDTDSWPLAIRGGLGL